MGKYDHAMKVLVDADPLAIVRFVLSQNERTRYLVEPGSGLRLIEQLNTEFHGTEAVADGLLLLETSQGKTFIVHIEFQSSRDGNMGDRLLGYALRIRQKYGPLPIISCVVYLQLAGIIEEPPHTWRGLDGSVTMIFDFIDIRLWTVPREEILALKQPALLPLALLTKGSIDRILVKEMFEELLVHKLYDLLPIGQTITGWLFQEIDLEWLKKEYYKMLDFLKIRPLMRG